MRFLGLSEVGETLIRRAHAVHPISAVQSEYRCGSAGSSAMSFRSCVSWASAWCRSVPWDEVSSPAPRVGAEEYPEGDYRRSGDPRLQGANYDANQRAVGVVTTLAQHKNATPGQVALAWLLHKGQDFVPIPGTQAAQVPRRERRSGGGVAR